MKKFLLILFSSVILFAGCSKGINLDKEAKKLNVYDIEIVVQDETRVDGVERIEYTNRTGDELTQLHLHLYPNAFAEGVTHSPVGNLHTKKAYPNGESYGGIIITSLKIGKTAVEAVYEGDDNNILVVNLPKKLANNKSITIEIAFSITVPNINHRFGYGENALNLGNFYPVLAVYENGQFVCNPYNSNGDPFYSDMANYNVTITAPSNFVLASTGEILSEKTDGENRIYSVKALAVRDFACVLSDKFEVLDTTSGKTKVMYYYYDDETADYSLETAKLALETFTELFGEYPYSTLSVVKTNFVHGGMEYPNLVYISDAVTKQSDYINVIVHEIAHQWWYQLVGSDAFRHPWLDEGLTEFSTLLFYENNPQYGISLPDAIKSSTNSFINFIDLYEEVIGPVDTSMNRAIDQYNTETEYVYMTYVKGCLFFSDLRDLVGNKKFIASLQSYFNEYKFKNVAPSHMIGIFEKTCRRELASFFNSWTEGKVIIQNAA